ncbi:MAG: protein phosphatase 2C domain-containing protein [Sedimenticola sp.]
MNRQCNSFQWDSSAITHVGKVRKINEDACFERPESGLWVVADGMGGHSSGDLASSTIVTTLERLLLPDLLSDTVDLLEDNLQVINSQLLEEAMRRSGDTTIGSTVVILLAYETVCLLLWVGDSRAYRFRDGQLKQLTRDHTEVEELVEQGLLLRDDVENHPSANIITRAVGAMDELIVDLVDYAILEGDIFLLCSDGLNKEVTDREIAAMLSRPESMQEINQALIDLTLSRGARDNVSVVLTRAEKRIT